MKILHSYTYLNIYPFSVRGLEWEKDSILMSLPQDLLLSMMEFVDGQEIKELWIPHMGGIVPFEE